MPEEERRVSPAIAIVGAGLALGVGAALVYALTVRAAPPGLANLYGEAIDEAGNPIPGTLFTLNGLSAYTDANGNCAFLELEPGPYSGSCSKSGYEVVSVTLNGIPIPFFEGGIMEDLILPEGDHQLSVVFREVVVIPVGRIGKWSYSTTVLYPTAHRETGDWPNHLLDFEYDLHPSTFFITVRCHNDSVFPITGKLEVVGTNATIHNQAPELVIPAGGVANFHFSMGLPRVRGEYYFDVVFSADGVVLDEGRWTIDYDAEVTLASLDIQAKDEAGNPIGDVLFRVDSLEALTDPGGACAFTDLELGSHPCYCYKEGYEVTSIKLNEVEIPVSDGYF